LFDEATSALDVVSERLTKEALDCVLLGRTAKFLLRTVFPAKPLPLPQLSC
jgi:ABC-type multidrug transport system fused ATPase/permease subunit